MHVVMTYGESKKSLGCKDIVAPQWLRYIDTDTHTRTHTRTHTHTHTHTTHAHNTHTDTDTHTHMHTRTHRHTHTGTLRCMIECTSINAYNRFVCPLSDNPMIMHLLSSHS